MPPDVCEVCGAADPRWVHCDTPECAAVIEERYGPPGNDAALARVTGALKLDIEFRTL